MNGNDSVIVLTTLPSEADARDFATMLVTERLAACVNVHAEMESVYPWKGQIEHSRERQLVIKTSSGRVAALEARFKDLHPYELPEFVVIPIIGGTRAYLEWIVQGTT